MLSSIICRMKACCSVKNEQSSASSSFLIFPGMTQVLSAPALGSRSPAAIARSMSRPDTPWMSLITDDSFQMPVFQQLLQRPSCAVRASGPARPVPGRRAQPAISSGGTKLPASDPAQ